MKGIMTLSYGSATHELISMPVEQTALTRPLSRCKRSFSFEIYFISSQIMDFKLMRIPTYKLLMMLDESDGSD